MTALLLLFNWPGLDTRIGGEKLSSFLWCIGIILATLVLKKPLTRMLAKLSTVITSRFTDKRHGSKFRTLIHSPLESLVQTILFYIAINQLGILLGQFVLYHYKSRNDALAVRFSDITDHIFLFLTILFTTLILSRVADFIYYVQYEKALHEENKERQQLLPLVKEVAKLLLWSIGLFWVLGSVFHVNIPALITGLGIGGVAIALAAKESVENLFAAFTILTDKPFQTGDLVRLGTVEGHVERIGFRSTRLRSVDGSAFIIPNKKLVNENLENLTRREARRVKMVLNIRYGTSHGQLQQMMGELEAMLRHNTRIMSPVEVNIESFGENTLQVVLSYYLPEPLPPGITPASVKQELSLRAYEIASRYAAFNNLSVGEHTTKDSDEGEVLGENREDLVI